MGYKDRKWRKDNRGEKDESIYIIRYRQGARIPEVIDLTDEYAGEKPSAIGFEVESERDKEEEA